MPQFLVIAKDFNDSKALERRMAARANHLQMAQQLKEKGNFIKAAAFLGDDGQMNGSAMLLEFHSRSDLDLWLQNEPYLKEKVWDSIEVSEVKVAPL
jgi:uncharacterized protein YciI